MISGDPTHATMSHGGAVLDVDAGAIVANWRELARRHGAAAAAVVKADAYGHGAAAIAPALARAGCAVFFTAHLPARWLSAALPCGLASCGVVRGERPACYGAEPGGLSRGERRELYGDAKDVWRFDGGDAEGCEPVDGAPDVAVRSAGPFAETEVD